MDRSVIINLFYIFSAMLFIFGLKMMGHPSSARKGNLLSSLGMLVAIVVTLMKQEIISYQWIAIGMGVGGVLGVFAARLVAMTSMPEMVALLNGFGGISSLLVGLVAFLLDPKQSSFALVTILFSVVIGGVTFTGSLIAWGKLKEVITGKAIQFPGQQVLNSLLLLSVVGLGVKWCLAPDATIYLWVVVGASLVVCLAQALWHRRWRSTALELCVLAILFALTPPLVGFAVYFCCVHSARHIASIMSSLRQHMSLAAVTVQAAIFSVGSWLAGAVAIWWLADAGDPQPVVLRVVFIGLAALTVPHMILVDGIYRRTNRSMRRRFFHR